LATHIGRPNNRDLTLSFFLFKKIQFWRLKNFLKTLHFLILAKFRQFKKKGCAAAAGSRVDGFRV
jgi:hypothetical protein